MQQLDEKPPGDGRGRPAQGDPTIPPSTKIKARLPRIGCPCGCLNGVDCTIASPSTDRPDGWWSDPIADCRCQRAQWTAHGVFICVCRREAAS